MERQAASPAAASAAGPLASALRARIRRASSAERRPGPPSGSPGPGAGRPAGRRAGTGAPGPSSPPPAVVAGRRTTGWPIAAGGRGSGGCGRSRAARAAASARASALDDLEVRARLARPVGVGGHARAHARGRGRSARRSCPLRAAGRPSTSARYSRSISARLDLRLQRAGGPRRSSPPPAARRCRGRAGGRSRRAGSSPPAGAPGSACASVPSAMPGRRVHDQPGGLVDHQQVLVLEGDGERRPAPRGVAAPSARARRPRPTPRAPSVALGDAARPSTGTAPAAISRCAAAREPSARRGATSSALARRLRRAPSAQSLAIGSMPRASQDRSSARTPSVIATSARLNAGQHGELTKSVTAPVARRGRSGCPSAPPSSSPVGSQPSGRWAWQHEVREQGRRARRRDSDDHRPLAVARPAPNATPVLRTCTRSRPGRPGRSLAAVDRRRGRAPSSLVERDTTQRQRRSAARRQPAAPGGSPADERRRRCPPTMLQHEDRDDRAEVERAQRSADEAPEDAQVGLGHVAQEVEHRVEQRVYGMRAPSAKISDVRM